MNLWIVIPLAALVLSAVLTATALRYARRRSLLDEPGPRRSHTEPTPRGGGIGILVALLAVVAGLFACGLLPWNWALGLGVGLLLVGLTGWWDDHRPLDPRIRFAMQAVAAAWLVFICGGIERLDLGAWSLPLGVLDDVLPFIGILWLTNLYNFMDGIDALAVSEGAFAGTVMGAWLYLAGEPGLALLALALAASCAGLWPWNLPPARIFMGDVGSTTLGFAFGGLALLGANSGAMPAVASLLVLSVFVLDATFTLIARIMRRERWYTPHREHAYQHLVRAGASHGRAVTGLMAVNVLVILPMVFLMYLFPGMAGVLAGLGVLAGWALWYECRRRCAALEGVGR